MSRYVLTPFVLFACTGPETTDSGTHTHTDEPSAFALRFAAAVDGEEVGCGDGINGLGPTGAHNIGMSDLRFYVSNLALWDAGGERVEATFDEDEFQYTGASDWVALVDLTSDTTDACSAGSISFSEGTARVHESITGLTHVEEVAAVSFDVGLSQPLMKEVIAENTPEGAPSPLGELYWSWAMGYRHFVFNFTVSDGMEDGEGYVHVGSTGCAAMGELALESKETCDFVNTAQVALADFDLATDAVAVDLEALLVGLDFVTPLVDPKTMEVIGEQVGAECHSSPMQPDCANVLPNLGIDLTNGAADPAANSVFGAL